jgi:hypothetical protein
MTDDCKVCNSIYDVREGGESTGYCDPCAQDRVAELEHEIDPLALNAIASNKLLSERVHGYNAREELVQEVIEAAKNFWGRGAMDDLTTLAPKRQALLDAARKLAEWKP